MMTPPFGWLKRPHGKTGVSLWMRATTADIAPKTQLLQELFDAVWSVFWSQMGKKNDFLENVIKQESSYLKLTSSQ